jgi:hypothetical protein
LTVSGILTGGTRNVRFCAWVEVEAIPPIRSRARKPNIRRSWLHFMVLLRCNRKLSLYVSREADRDAMLQEKPL